MMMIIGTMGLAFALPVFPSTALADQISLVCKGTWNVTIDGRNEDVDSSGSIIIDLDTKLAQSTWGNHDIVSIKSNYIGLKSQIPPTLKKPPGIMTGGIDRLSGELSLVTSYDGGKSYESVQKYVCVRAKAIF